MGCIYTARGVIQLQAGRQGKGVVLEGREGKKQPGNTAGSVSGSLLQLPSLCTVVRVIRALAAAPGPRGNAGPSWGEVSRMSLSITVVPLSPRTPTARAFPRGRILLSSGRAQRCPVAVSPSPKRCWAGSPRAAKGSEGSGQCREKVNTR